MKNNSKTLFIEIGKNEIFSLLVKQSTKILK